MSDNCPKSRPIIFSGPMVRAILDGRKTQTRRVVKAPHSVVWDGDTEPPVSQCPYGQPGDLLWVREALGCFSWCEGEESRYVADGEVAGNGWPWKRPTLPAMFMPRELSRFTLRITDVRVERVQNISREDVYAEGLNPYGGGLRNGTAKRAFGDLWDRINAKPKPVYRNGRVDHYVSYPWADVHEKCTHRGKNWFVHGNPWVWAVSFEGVEP